MSGALSIRMALTAAIGMIVASALLGFYSNQALASRRERAISQHLDTIESRQVTNAERQAASQTEIVERLKALEQRLRQDEETGLPPRGHGRRFDK